MWNWPYHPKFVTHVYAGTRMHAHTHVHTHAFIYMYMCSKYRFSIIISEGIVYYALELCYLWECYGRTWCATWGDV